MTLNESVNRTYLVWACYATINPNTTKFTIVTHYLLPYRHPPPPFLSQSYKEKDAGKVVLYTTSMGIVRHTYAKCANVKQILRTLLVKFEERDVFMSIECQQEIRDRMQSDEILVPQLYVDGHHVGVSALFVMSSNNNRLISFGFAIGPLAVVFMDHFV